MCEYARCRSCSGQIPVDGDDRCIYCEERFLEIPEFEEIKEVKIWTQQTTFRQGGSRLKT